ncbi:MAG: rod shape-determining protein [Candidatus Berkelbacteria bacterium]|nr:rod shape-determining protein [Candidatus Berkelbacteria bacterium]
MANRIAIDLGTTNVLVYLPKKGIVVDEPSVVALQAENNQIVAIGEEAKNMIGRTPESIVAAHPLKDGVIANYNISEAMLRHFINRVSGKIRFTRPEVMIATPVGITSTERRAVIDAVISAGAKQAYLIKEPIAAALGAGVPIAAPSGNMIIDIGGGTTEVAVISLGDVVASTSVRVGGDKIDIAISNYVRKKHNLIIGEQTAEETKKRIGSAIEPKKEQKMEVSGSNAITGLPESLVLTSSDIVKAIKPPLLEIINAVKSVLQKTPPELASDVMDKGIIITGGGALLENIDTLLTKVTGVPCQVAEDPRFCVVKGAGIAVEHLDAYKKSILWARE